MRSRGRTSRLAAVTALLAAVALIVALAASAVIIPQRGLAGLRLGMTQAKVRSVLGEPGRVVRGSNEFGAYTEFVYRSLRVSFQGNASVTNLRTTRRSERTKSGVGVGSSEVELRRKVGGIRCRTEFGFRHCFLGRFLAGRRVTDFRIVRGRVASIDIGFVID